MNNVLLLILNSTAAPALRFGAAVELSQKLVENHLANGTGSIFN